MTFRSIIRFRVKPGMEADFEAAFLKAGMLERPARIDGFVSAELVRSVAGPVEYYVIGEWRTEQAYVDWQTISRDGADPDAIAAMQSTLVDHAPGRLFEPLARSK